MMDLTKVNDNVEQAQKALQERTSQLQQADPVFQNLVGQFNAWKTMQTSLDSSLLPHHSEASPGDNGKPGGAEVREKSGAQRSARAPV
jgi:hypothetical protein